MKINSHKCAIPVVVMELRCFPRYSTSIHHTAAVIRHVAQHEAAVESAFGESFIVCLFFIAFFELNDFKLFWLERSWCSARDENFFRAIARRLSVHLSASQREKWRVGCYAILWRSAFVEIVTYNFSSSSEENTLRGAGEQISISLWWRIKRISKFYTRGNI